MREAEKLCDRIAILHRGSVLAEGTLDELRERHDQQDLEELFFQLISQHDRRRRTRHSRLQYNEVASNVKLILAREVRDQLRDRRTLFMIAVLPILLYPLLGMSLFQISQFMHEQPDRVLVVGGRNLNVAPPLFEGGRFAAVAVHRTQRGEAAGAAFSRRRTPSRFPVRKSVRRVGRQPVQQQRRSIEAALCFPTRLRARRDAEARHVDPCRPVPTRRLVPPDFAGGSTNFASRARRGDRGNRRFRSPTCPSRNLSTTRPTRNRSWPRSRSPECLQRWTQRDRRGKPEGRRHLGPGRRTRLRSNGRRGRCTNNRDGAHVVEDPARAAAALGPDRRVLSGRRPLRRRKGTRHAGDPAEQPRRRGAKSCSASC